MSTPGFEGTFKRQRVIEEQPVNVADVRGPSEDRVIFEDAGQVRALRGRVLEAGPTWVRLARRDGLRMLRTDTVLRIEFGADSPGASASERAIGLYGDSIAVSV